MDLISVFGGLESVTVFLGKAFLVTFGAATVFGIGQVVLGVFSLVKAFKTLGVVGLLSNVASFLIPILIGAAVIALIAVFEDLFSFLKNRGTVLEDYLNGLKIPKENIEALRKSLQKLAEAIKKTAVNVFDKILSIFGTSKSEEQGKNIDKNIVRIQKLTSALSNLADATDRIGDFFDADEKSPEELAAAAKKTAKDLKILSQQVGTGTTILDLLGISGKGTKADIQKTEDTINFMENIIKKIRDNVFGRVDGVKTSNVPSVGEQTLRSMGSLTSAKQPVVNQTVIEKIDINVTESENPEATAQAVSDSLGEKFKEAERDTVGQVAK